MGDLIERVRKTTAAHQEAQRRLNELTNDINSTAKKLTGAQQMGRRPALIAQHQETLNLLVAERARALAEVEATKEAYSDAATTLGLLRERRWDHDRLPWLYEYLGLSPVDDVKLDLRINDFASTRHQCVRIEVHLMEMDPQTGRRALVHVPEYPGKYPAYSYEKTISGFETTVYGPEWQCARYDRETGTGVYEWTGAQVSWPSIGSVSLADAEVWARIHTLAIRLARLLEQQRDAWAAEDEAD